MNNSRLQNKAASASQARYIPGLDGLRALSVLAVMAYHLNLPLASGGFVGVGIFFTLSGYLITRQLLEQWSAAGRIDLKTFWLRRLRRLMPAMAFMLIGVWSWLLLVDSSRLAALRDDFMSAGLYVHNWWLIGHNVSYFESFGPPSPLVHFWSLAIEEQFYLLWPLMLSALLRIFPRRGLLALSILMLSAASALAMAVVYTPGTDPSRVYYGTDTRAFALLIGAALAVIWPDRLAESLTAKARWTLDLVGSAGLLAIIGAMTWVNEYDESLYKGNLLLLSIASAIVIAALAHPAGLLARWMEHSALRWIGKRSYSLYLWHYPIIILMNAASDTGSNSIAAAVIAIALSFLAVSFSWTFVEEPIRRGTFRPAWDKLRIGLFRKPRFMLMLAVLSFLMISCSNNGLLDAKPPGSAAHAAEEQTGGSSPNAEKAPDVEPPILAEPESDKASHNGQESPQPDHSSNGTSAASGKHISVIGDSVILDAAPHLEKLFPGIVVEGKVGRQMSQAQEVVDRLKDNGTLGDIVIIELGTNGTFNTSSFRKLIASLDEQVERILIINTRVPRKWQDVVNEKLATVADDFEKASIVDWYAASEGKESLFARDNVHLNLEGARYYASLISKAIQQEER